VAPQQVCNTLRKAINRALLELTQDGTYQRLYTRWFDHIAPVK
jgi:ABC-type amino acid transport substrate-binding protein